MSSLTQTFVVLTIYVAYGHSCHFSRTVVCSFPSLTTNVYKFIYVFLYIMYILRITTGCLSIRNLIFIKKFIFHVTMHLRFSYFMFCVSYHMLN